MCGHLVALGHWNLPIGGCRSSSCSIIAQSPKQIGLTETTKIWRNESIHVSEKMLQDRINIYVVVFRWYSDYLIFCQNFLTWLCPEVDLWHQIEVSCGLAVLMEFWGFVAVFVLLYLCLENYLHSIDSPCDFRFRHILKTKLINSTFYRVTHD